MIVLEPRGRGRFDEARIVAASAQAITDAACVLRQLGFSDADADHEAIRGPLGVWRKVRSREDRGRPGFVIWQPGKNPTTLDISG